MSSGVRECGCHVSAFVDGLCIHQWKQRAEWWEFKKATEGVDVRDLYILGERYLPPTLAGDLGFASTTTAWFHRLKNWLAAAEPTAAPGMEAQ